MSEEVVNESENISALQANIKEKGQNAYYYAHGLKINGPAWDGKEEPRLLHVSDDPNKISTKKFVQNFESYAWVDNGKTIKVYIDHDNADQIDASQITLDNTDKYFKFQVSQNDKSLQLNIDELDAEITQATYKAKSSKFILTLSKKNEDSTWYQLKKKKNN